MAQPALTKNPLGIAPFWQKASVESPTEWEKWNQELYLGIVAKDGINLKKVKQKVKQKLSQNPPTIRKPQEPGYELPIEGETQSQTRDWNMRKIYSGITSVPNWITWDPPWTEYQGKKPTLNSEAIFIYASDTKAKDVSVNITQIRAFWNRLEHIFIKDRNVSFDRYEAFTRSKTRH